MEVLGRGSAADNVSAVAHATRRGFETGIPLPGPAKFVAARAISASGATLARSKVVRVRSRPPGREARLRG